MAGRLHDTLIRTLKNFLTRQTSRRTKYLVTHRFFAFQIATAHALLPSCCATLLRRLGTLARQLGERGRGLYGNERM